MGHYNTYCGKTTTKHVEIETTDFEEQTDGSFKPVTISGFIVPTKASKLKPDETIRPIEENDILKVDFVDVQQGDGTVLETPGGKVVLLDGGDNQLFARYLASRYRGTADGTPKQIDCILVSHGDADHFAGLTQIHKSETHEQPHKRLSIFPRRVYHNGLVKRPGKKTVIKNGKKKKVDRPDKEMFGTTKKKGKDLVVTELVDNLLEVDDSKMNSPFRQWKKALKAFSKRAKRNKFAIEIRRLKQGDDDAFDFLINEQIEAEVLGPIMTKVEGKDGLLFLGNPPKGPRVGDEPKFTGFSASHTVNGHSIILRIRYGKFRFLFSGDLNREAELDLINHHKKQLHAEIFKVPHHGSADFSSEFIKAVRPLCSIASSGDESTAKEHIHPRANLMGALGRFSRKP